MIIGFQDIPHFRIFPLTPILKFQNATYFNTGPIAKKSNSPYSTMVDYVLIKFGWDHMKTQEE